MDEQIELSRYVKVARHPPRNHEFAALKEQGIRSIIDLRTDAEPAGEFALPGAEEHGARAQGIDYARVPVSATAVSRDDLDRFGNALHDAAKPVLIHCASGRRAGMMALAHTAIETGTPGGEMMEMARNLDLVFGDPAQQHVFADYVDRHEIRTDPLTRRQEALRAEGHPIPLLPEATQTIASDMQEERDRKLALDHGQVIREPAGNSNGRTEHVRPQNSRFEPIPVTVVRPRPSRIQRTSRPPPRAPVSPPSKQVSLGAAAALAGAVLLILDRRLLVPALLVAGVIGGRAVMIMRDAPPGSIPPGDPILDRDIADLERRVRRLNKTA